MEAASRPSRKDVQQSSPLRLGSWPSQGVPAEQPEHAESQTVRLALTDPSNLNTQLMGMPRKAPWTYAMQAAYVLLYA